MFECLTIWWYNSFMPSSISVSHQLLGQLRMKCGWYIRTRKVHPMPITPFSKYLYLRWCSVLITLISEVWNPLAVSTEPLVSFSTTSLSECLSFHANKRRHGGKYGISSPRGLRDLSRHFPRVEHRPHIGPCWCTKLCRLVRLPNCSLPEFLGTHCRETRPYLFRAAKLCWNGRW
jgi:hypothetical protein